MPRGSILVIDDETEIREGLEALLSSENFVVTLAETGEAGLRKLSENPFDLLLLDVSLPGSNGLELLREVKQRRPDLPALRRRRVQDDDAGVRRRSDTPTPRLRRLRAIPAVSAPAPGRPAAENEKRDFRPDQGC